MILEEGKFMIFWNSIFAMLVLVNFIYAPFITAMTHLRVDNASTVNSFETTIEVFWLASIIINFVTASQERKIFRFKESARRYLYS